MLFVTHRNSLVTAWVLGVSLLACGGDDDGGGGGDSGDQGGGDDGGLPDLPDADPSCAGAPAPARELVATGLDRPIFLTAPAGDDRLFIIEQQAALIRIVDAGGELLETPFLDLSDTVGNNGSYTGALGLAFHPDYASNGRFFVTYTDSLGGSGAMDLALAEYGVSEGDPDVANPDPVGEPILFAVSTANGHYGGQIAFGPDDMLYVGFGDMDGEGGNMSGSAQDLANLAGKILRIDTGDAVGEASVPDDNPFVDQGGARGEVFAYGLRVPWRFAFDSMTGDFFVADVGQNRIEEVNVVPSGELSGTNFGWAIVEGTLCVDDPCDAEGVQPAYAYDHEGGAPRAIIGGAVYRGTALSCLGGRYFFADHETGAVQSFALNASGQAAGLEEHPALRSSLITSFGTDGHGEMYILELEGDVFRIVPAERSRGERAARPPGMTRRASPE